MNWLAFGKSSPAKSFDHSVKMPWVGFAFIVGGLTSMGMPGLSGFIAEFPIFTGMWKASEQITLQAGGLVLSNYYSVIVVIAALGIVITASYIMRIIGRVFFGEIPEEFEGHISNINNFDRVALVLLAGILILIGVYPSVMAPMVESGAKTIWALFGGA